MACVGCSQKSCVHISPCWFPELLVREFGKQPFSTPKLFGGFTLPLSTAGRVGKPLAPPRVRSISLDFEGLMASKITAVNALTGEQVVQAGGRAGLQAVGQARPLLNWTGLSGKVRRKLDLQSECWIFFVAGSVALLSEEHWAALGRPLDLMYVVASPP